MRRVVILGSTGSIGRQALEVCAKEREQLEVVGLAAHTSVELLVEQTHRFAGVKHVALGTAEAVAEARQALDDSVKILTDTDALIELIEATAPDIVINALVGAAGLRATMTTLEAGITLALANKESLVAGGELVMAQAKPGQLLPVDSEHSAIFQCLRGESSQEISRLWLTASGGPFRGYTRDELRTVTPEQALAHPTWSMGRKISIDSATMMNKGLEVIEAHHLFEINYDDIEVVVHPQSVVHSMAEFVDSTVLAHLGPTDMRIPIQYALSYPSRWSAPLKPLDLTHLSDLTFEPVDTKVFRALKLAYEAGRVGGSAPVALNAANEVAVDLFLENYIGLLDIAELVEDVLNMTPHVAIESIEHIEEIDIQARAITREAAYRRMEKQ
ncbi:MAG: 1-deoxy-D-xylulose-5-phosphate reductoisomerase [Coriobacteriia bacterium]|nr:1-deoxy-D-xylulose-5-phosphate reductoisomerase [Coriobacteriia bacterium]